MEIDITAFFINAGMIDYSDDGRIYYMIGD
jgi:hypothetical protein